MIELQLGFGVVDMSSDVYNDFEDEIRKYQNASSTVVSLIKPEIIGVLDIIENRGHKRPRSIRSLYAHGRSDHNDDTYNFFDNTEKYRVTDWIDLFDGKYDALFIVPCNSDSIELRPRKSFIAYPMELCRPSYFVFGNDRGSLVLMPPGRAVHFYSSHSNDLKYFSNLIE